jgi:cyclic pyranopterin phosphate synthase
VKLLANEKMRIITTAKCNLDCFYCHNEGQAKDDSFLEIETLQSVARAMQAVGATANETTVSGGEPLLHARLTSIVSMARSFSSSVTMVSNGLLADEARLAPLVSAGLHKLRLGIDSLRATKPRPSKGYLEEPFQLEALLYSARRLGLEVDMNVVITKFNRLELGQLARFAVDHSLSIKFFEHVDVDEFGGGGRGGVMNPRPQVAYEDFIDQLRISVSPDIALSASDEFGEANLSCVVDASEIRYCRYLCSYDLCWLTGTRVDAQGYVYNCMVNRGIDQLRAGADPRSVVDVLQTASHRPCRSSEARELPVRKC